jgi:hypothetical protein
MNGKQFICILFSTLTVSSALASDVPTVALKLEQELRLKEPLAKGREPFVSSVSGLVFKAGRFYLVADDENALFGFAKDQVVSTATLFDRELPVEPTAREILKADFESLVLLDEKTWPPYGALVAWPSGSTPQRMLAITVPFDGKGNLQKPMESKIATLADLFNSYASDLNIEGILVGDKKVFLFNRGNNKSNNGSFEIALDAWVNGLKTGDWNTNVIYEKIKIGRLDGVRLGVTDVVQTKYGVLALAAAEDTISAYADGTVSGTVLVRLAGSKAEILAQFDPITKLEGIAIKEEPASGGISIYLVDDADDPKKPSKLYSATLTAEQLVMSPEMKLWGQSKN